MQFGISIPKRNVTNCWGSRVDLHIQMISVRGLPRTFIDLVIFHSVKNSKSKSIILPRLIELTKTTLPIRWLKLMFCVAYHAIHTIVQVLCDIISSQLWSVPGESLKKCEGPQKKFVPLCYLLFCIYPFWLVVDYSILLHIPFKISWMLDMQN